MPAPPSDPPSRPPETDGEASVPAQFADKGGGVLGGLLGVGRAVGAAIAKAVQGGGEETNVAGGDADPAAAAVPDVTDLLERLSKQDRLSAEAKVAAEQADGAVAAAESAPARLAAAEAALESFRERDVVRAERTPSHPPAALSRLTYPSVSFSPWLPDAAVSLFHLPPAARQARSRGACEERGQAERPRYDRRQP